MMKFSPAAELAVRGAIALTENFGQGPTTLATICEENDLSREYLAKVFGMLARADLVTSIRGKNGGYVLAHNPDQISLLQILEAVEGPLVLNLCQYVPPRCDRVDGCKIHPIWSELQAHLRDKLGSVKLADCI